jgi:hypothetical protein
MTRAVLASVTDSKVARTSGPEVRFACATSGPEVRLAFAIEARTAGYGSPGEYDDFAGAAQKFAAGALSEQHEERNGARSVYPGAGFARNSGGRAATETKQ